MESIKSVRLQPFRFINIQHIFLNDMSWNYMKKRQIYYKQVDVLLVGK